MYNPLTDRRKKILIKEFQNLKEINSKFDFWQKKFKSKYIEYLIWKNPNSRLHNHSELTQKFHDLQDFEISCLTDSVPTYNKLILEEYKLYFNGRYDNISNVNQREVRFDTKLEENQNKKGFIENEIKKIDALLIEKTKDENKPGDSSKFFIKGFNDCYLNNQDVDLSVFYTIENLIEVHNGRTEAKYKKYLENQLSNVLKKNKYKMERQEISVSQQYLIMHYLGILGKIKATKNATKTANFLFLLFNKTRQEVYEKVNTYDLRDSSDDKERNKTKHDLEIILPLFESINLEDVANTIKSDIEKLVQKRVSKL